MPAILTSPSGPPKAGQASGDRPQQIEVEAILWTWSSQPSYGVHRDRKVWSSKLVVVWMSGNHPTQKLNTSASRWKRLRPGRKEQNFISHLIFVVPCIMLNSEINPTRCNNCVYSSQWLYSTCFG